MGRWSALVLLATVLGASAAAGLALADSPPPVPAPIVAFSICPNVTNADITLTQPPTGCGQRVTPSSNNPIVDPGCQTVAPLARYPGNLGTFPASAASQLGALVQVFVPGGTDPSGTCHAGQIVGFVANDLSVAYWLPGKKPAIVKGSTGQAGYSLIPLGKLATGVAYLVSVSFKGATITDSSGSTVQLRGASTLATLTMGGQSPTTLMFGVCPNGADDAGCGQVNSAAPSLLRARCSALLFRGVKANANLGTFSASAANPLSVQIHVFPLDQLSGPTCPTLPHPGAKPGEPTLAETYGGNVRVSAFLRTSRKRKPKKVLAVTIPLAAGGGDHPPGHSWPPFGTLRPGTYTVTATFLGGPVSFRPGPNVPSITTDYAPSSATGTLTVTP